MSAAKLKPCPFCGGTAHMRKECDEDETHWNYIACGTCGGRTRGKWVSGPSNTCPIYYAEVRDEWNKRPSPWRPIKDAPRDGTRVDLFGTRNGDPRRFTGARWLETHVPGYGTPTGEYRWQHSDWDIYGEFEYTHWMPLPAEPLPHADLSENQSDG